MKGWWRKWCAWRAYRRGLWWAERARNVAAALDDSKAREVRLLEMKAKANAEPELDRWGYPTIDSARTSKEWQERWERLARRQHIAEMEAELGWEPDPLEPNAHFTAEDFGSDTAAKVHLMRAERGLDPRTGQPIQREPRPEVPGVCGCGRAPWCGADSYAECRWSEVDPL
jgi:hypothetical protein